VKPAGFESLRGKLLLDGGSLTGSFFHRTVVLICQHDEEGAFGLVLNRPAGSTLGEMVDGGFEEEVGGCPVFVGGPVQPSAFSYLYSFAGMAQENVMELLSLGHELDEFVELREGMGEEARVRVFAGYAGWSAGQLESEMERKAWLVHPASLELVFGTEPEELWKVILRQQGWEQRLLADSPEDAAWN
jgi:putative transcriptional regulator